MKVARVGLRRDNNFLYYVRADGNVWRSPRKKPGSKAKGKKEKVASTAVDLDYSRNIYFVDSDGDVASKPRKNAKKR